MNAAEVIAYCMTFKNVYQDLPFRDEKQIVIRHRGNRKVFAWFYEEKGVKYVRFPCSKEPEEQWLTACGLIEKDIWEKNIKWLRVRLNNGQETEREAPEKEEAIPCREALKIIATAGYEMTKPDKKRKSSSWYFQ